MSSPSLLCALLATAVGLCGGCSSFFNQSFINLIANPVPDASGRVPGFTIDNAPGHVVIVFINNTQFDPRLLAYFEGIGIDTSDPDLRPRVRLRVDIRYVNNNVATFEFLDGSDLIENTFLSPNGPVQIITTPPRDLVENDLTNIVTVCDVGVVQPGGGIVSSQSSIEVFQPAILRVNSIQVNQNVTTIERVQTPPQFLPLLADEVDGNLNITLQRNLDIRDIPVPAVNLLCGSVVGLTLTGTLQVPFIVDGIEGNVPGYDGLNPTIPDALIPGRFSFLTTVR